MRTDEKTHGLLGAVQSTLDAIHATVKAGFAARAVLACETWQFDADGRIERQWRVPFGAVAISTDSADPVTVTSASPSSEPPTQGPGVAVIRGAGVANIAGRSLTLYGNPGDTVTVEVFLTSRSPSWAPFTTPANTGDVTPPAVTGSVVMRPADPAPGQAAVLTVPAGQTWTLRSAYAHFTTGVETAGRMLVLQYADATGVFAVFPCPAPISVPTNTYTPTWGENLGQYDTAHTSRAAGLGAIPLPAGSQIQISATNLQADDAFTNVAFCVDVSGAADSADIVVERPANPAAGTPVTLTVPTGKTWTVHTASASFKCGAETVDRMAVLQYLDSSGVFASFPCPGTVTTAGAVINPTWGDGLGQYESTHQTRASSLDSIVLTAGMQVQFAAVGMQADDTLTAAALCVDEQVVT